MFIALPLMLIGVGFMIYLPFAATIYVLPLYAALSTGFAALQAGASYPGALLLGITAALLVIFSSHIASSSRGRATCGSRSRCCSQRQRQWQ